jgi:aminotransferase
VNIKDMISPIIRDMPPSGIRRFFDLVDEIEGAVSLGVGEPDFITPWHIREASIYSLEEGYTHYTSNWGLPGLRREIARYLSHRFNVDYNPEDQIIVTVGASEAIDLALRAIVTTGDEVLVPEPSYVSYMPCVEMAGGRVVPIVTKADDEFRLTAQALRETITPRTKALILPYPNNPTGGVMLRSDLEAIADVLEDTDILVLSDEIYAELTYGDTTHVSIASLPGMAERTVVISGFSKAFAMTGWRVGYAAGHKDIIAAMVKIHQYTMLCAPIMSQIAATEALRAGYNDGYEDIKRMHREYDRRRRLMVKSFNDMGLECFEPRGAFYVFPSIQRTGMSSDEFCERLLQEQKVAVVPGNAFGASGEGFIRCSYAYSIDALTEALKRIKVFAEKYVR